MARFMTHIFLILVSLSSYLADDSYIFAYLRWPGGLCDRNQCCFPSTWTPKDGFMVNYIANSSTSAECTDSSFNLTALDPILTELYEYWPSFTCPNTTQVNFWKTKWEDNGICTRFTELEYFSTALEIRDEANITSLLADRGIVPSATTLYNLTEVLDAIDDGLGVANTSVLYCGSTSNHIIRNIRLCVDGSGSGFITCPTVQTSSCNSSVYLLPLSETTVSVPAYPTELYASE